MKADEYDRLQSLLREALPPAGREAETGRDLWPAMQLRIQSHSVAEAALVGGAIPWFDWALAGGLVALAVVSPVFVPVLLYYL